jgi:hypothetical protein
VLLLPEAERGIVGDEVASDLGLFFGKGNGHPYYDKVVFCRGKGICLASRTQISVIEIEPSKEK